MFTAEIFVVTFLKARVDQTRFGSNLRTCPQQQSAIVFPAVVCAHDVSWTSWFAGTVPQAGEARIAARNIVLSSPSDRGPVASGARYVNKLSVLLLPCSCPVYASGIHWPAKRLSKPA